MNQGPTVTSHGVGDVMLTVMLACDVLRHELKILTSAMRDPPSIVYLEQGLHDKPDNLRGKIQDAVDAFEREKTGTLTILCAYALCGRALYGVRSSRATLVLPRLHDCIPLLLGLEQKPFMALHSGPIYWLAPGFLQGSIFSPRLSPEALQRHAEYEKKYGPTRAARLIEAEKRMMQNYTKACHIRWSEVGDTYVAEAKNLADSIPLPYHEVEGSSSYLAELLQGGKDRSKFLHLEPGQTIDMDPDGAICAICS